MLIRKTTFLTGGMGRRASLLALATALSMIADRARADQPEPPSYAKSVSTMGLAAMFRQAEQSSADGSGESPAGDGEQEGDTLREALQMLPDDEPLGQGFDPDDPGSPNESIFAGRQTEVVDGELVLPPIMAGTTNTSEIGNGETPGGFRGGQLSPVVELPESGVDRGLPWQWQVQNWAAANTFSHPLYFEDRMLERHGHQRYPCCLQPFVSGGRFVAQWVALPYLSTIHPPSDCEYTLGYYRAGSCTPALRQRAPWSRKAAAAQATAVVTAVTILP